MLFHSKGIIVCLFTLSCLKCTLSIDISNNAFGSNRNFLPAAFGDFNSDELVDLFVLRNNGSILEILLANEKEPLLRQDEKSRLTCEFSSWRVTSVVPGDFDGDAFMDILLTTVNTNGTNKDFTDIRIIWGGEEYINCVDANEIKAEMIGQPLAIDYNHNMIVDLFGLDRRKKRMFWIFQNNREMPVEIPMSGKHSNDIIMPHSNSYLDLNGDYAADLLVSASLAHVEVWLATSFSESDDRFMYNSSIALPVGVLSGHVGQTLFLDVELTGELFLLLPICFDKKCLDCAIFFYKNNKWDSLHVDFADDSGEIWGFVPPDNDWYSDTITLRGGDYNMDGFPDLLVTLKRKTDFVTQTFLLENVKCESPECRRKYKIKWNALQPFTNGTHMAVFYDFYGDGTLDVIIVSKNKITNTFSVGAFKNGLIYDSNFINVMVLTGLRNKKVPETVGVLGKKKGTYGTNLPGPQISYTALSQNGHARVGKCAQLSKSAYQALNLPYSIFGLDRTPNFVDTLTVGMYYRSRLWTQLIPNSQMVVIPSPPADPSKWKVQLFVTPGKVILETVGAWSGIIVLIMLTVGFLHWKEKREDALEQLLENTDNDELET